MQKIIPEKCEHIWGNSIEYFIIVNEKKIVIKKIIANQDLNVFALKYAHPLRYKSEKCHP